MTGSVAGIRRRRTVAGRRETPHLPPDRDFYGQTLYSVCYRRRQPWPTVVTPSPSWNDLYLQARNNLLDNGDVLPTAAESVAWANELVRRIDTGE